MTIPKLDGDARLRCFMDFSADLKSFYGDPNMNRATKELFGGGMISAGTRGQTVRHEDKKVLPNAPFPCGSGKKYKKCCGAKSNA